MNSLLVFIADAENDRNKTKVEVEVEVEEVNKRNFIISPWAL